MVRRRTVFAILPNNPIISRVDETNTVALIAEHARIVKSLPAVVFALLFVGRRSVLRIAGIADAVSVKVGLVGVEGELAVVRSVRYAVAVRIRRAAADPRRLVVVK